MRKLKIKQAFSGVLLLLLVLLTCVACSGQDTSTDAAPPMSSDSAAMDYDYNFDPAPEASYDAYDGSYDTSDADLGSGYDMSQLTASNPSANKVIQRAYYNIETENYAETMALLEQKIAVSGSYIESSEAYARTEWDAAWCNLVIRVPTLTYGDFKNNLANVGMVVSSNESSDNVTAQYYDTEARLAVLQEQQERVLAFIAQAADLDQVFKIERELTSIRTEIEQLTTVKNHLQNLTSYATVTINIRELWQPEDISAVTGEPFNERVNMAFAGSLNGIVEIAQGLVILLIWIWPFLLLAAVVLVIIYGHKRKSAAKRSQQAGVNQRADDKQQSALNPVLKDEEREE